MAGTAPPGARLSFARSTAPNTRALECGMATELPQIDIGRRHGELLNVVQMLPLPADTPFGNLLRKYAAILERLDHVNGRIQGVFESYESAKANPLGRLSILHHTLLAEETVYWIRKTADELIWLVAFLTDRQATGAYPTSLVPFPIDEALRSKAPPGWIVDHVKFLGLLNDVSNAYKHSFVNSEVDMIGRDEPGVYALGLKWNDLGKGQPTLYNIRVAELVTRFDAFFRAAREQLTMCKLPHLEPGSRATERLTLRS